MSLQTVCRLCLSMNTPVRALDDGPLRDVYEKLTDISLTTPHRPLVACLLCYSQLRRCHNLMVRSVRADKVLSQILRRGELVTEDSIAMINWKAYQRNNLSFTPIDLITIPSLENNSMEVTIKEEPVKSEFKEEIDTDRPTHLVVLKYEESEEEEYVDGAGLGNTEDTESGVLKDEQDVKSEMFEEAVDVDNEGWASEQDIDTAVIGDITIEIEKLANEDDRAHDKLDGADNVKGEDMIPEVSDLENSESEDAAPAVKYKRTHTQLQNRTEQNIKDEHRTVEEELSNKNIGQRKFISRKNLVNLIKTHSGEKPFECAICQRRFARKDTLNAHLGIHNKVKPFECAICQRRFTVKVKLKKHLRIHTTGKPFECAICKRRFTENCYLTKHLRIHTKEKPYECAICQRRFTEKGSLKNHIRIHTKEKPFECAICQRRFTQNNNLNTHLKTHTKVKPFECAICQRKFTKKADLTKHLRIHTKEKPFKCTICERKFTEKGNLKKHLRIHTKEKPFECAVCQRRFGLKFSLNRHSRTCGGRPEDGTT